jgi:Zn-dependent protease with chaperone function
MATWPRFALIWGSCAFGGYVAISMLTFIGGWGSPTKIAAVASMSLVLGFVWGTISWWCLNWMKRGIIALLHYCIRRN